MADTRTARRLSFRAALTLRWTVAFGLLLTLALGAVYLGARAFGYHAIDAHVRTIAATELASSTDQGAPVHLHEFPATALNDQEFAPKFAQIYDRAGHVLLQSGSLGVKTPLLSETALAAAFAGQAPLVDITWQGSRGRMVALRSIDRDGQPFVLAVGMLTDGLETDLGRLSWLLAGIWLCALAATAAVGYGLASRVLDPIDRITRRAREIAREPGNIRLDPPQADDEIGRMTRLLNEMLDRLHRVIDVNRRFAADVSHELRSPLTAAAGEIDVALRRDRSAAEYRETLVLVRAQLDEMFRLVDNLMLLVHAEEGRRVIARRPVPVDLLLAQCRERLRRLAEERQVALRLDPVPADLVLFGDEPLFARVFDNIVANALQYTPPQGEVTMALAYRPANADAWATGEARISIRDTGPGIPREAWERIFDRFYRLDASRSRRTGGHGLGLPIARAILSLFEGSIRVAASSAQGTTFEIVLPCGPAPRDRAEAAAGGDAGARAPAAGASVDAAVAP